MSEGFVPIVTALVAAIPPTLVAAAALIATLRQRRTLTETQVEVGKVHVLVNSEMAAMKADLAASKAQIDALLLLITKLSAPALAPALAVPVEKVIVPGSVSDRRKPEAE